MTPNKMRERKMSWKSLLVKFGVAAFIALMVTSVLFGLPVLNLGSDGSDSSVESDVELAVDPVGWYKTVRGLLTSDSYTLYPYEQKSLDIGFSQFGEMISLDVPAGKGTGVGLQYPGWESVSTHDQHALTSADPFANERIAVSRWMNGWFTDIKYWRAGVGYREVWAFALFSDSLMAGGDWITMPEVGEYDPARPLWQEHPPYANPSALSYVPPLGIAYRGGRKTNGVAVTDPITVLYNGPRKFVALLKTRVMDKIGEDPELVDIYITVIFNKVEKSVILLKDIKVLYDKAPLNVQFGNRGEWDLDPRGYVHFYTDEPVQVWDLDCNGTIEPEEAEESREFFREWMVENKYPKKWWQDVDERQWPDSNDNGVPDPVEYGWLETQWTSYTSEWHVDPNIKQHGYAVAQVIDSNFKYVGAHAVWPHPEFWSVQDVVRDYVDGKPVDIPLMLAPLSRMLEWHRWTVDEDLLKKLPDRNDIWVKIDDMQSPVAPEPKTPWIIYEHDFELDAWIEGKKQYRVVSVYVLTDYHDADDANIGPGHINAIDREIQYQLDEIFSSWDLRDAMHKETKRWVQFFEGNDVAYEFYLDTARETEVGKWEPTIPVILGGWDTYSIPTERVIVLGAVITPRRNIDGDWYSYPYTYDITTGGVITFYVDKDGDGVIEPPAEYWRIPAGVEIKVLWSSPKIETKAEQWLWSDVTAVLGMLPLHHSIPRGVPKEETEVFTVIFGIPIALTHGEWVYRTWGTIHEIVIQKPTDGLPGCHYLWIDYATRDPEVIHSSEALDEFRTVFRVAAEPSAVSQAWVNETLISEADWATLIPEPMVGDYTDDWDIFTPGGIIVSIRGPYGGYIEVDIAYPPTVGPDELTRGDYVIHETWTCDELVLRWPLPTAILSPEVKIVYKVWGGRYEWTVVGKQAHTVDSIGASLVTAAIKNKNLEIGFAGMDMIYTEYGIQSVPNVMVKHGAGNAREDYYYSPTDKRTDLRDDWCPIWYYDDVNDYWTTTGGWPVSSSNMITVGGPLVNLLTYYTNDFVEAIYGIPEFTPYGPWSGAVAAITCWSKNAYYSSADVGYAVVATAKDKNATVIITIWGVWGRDTFYATKWFEQNKFILQHINPHVTSIILEIDYTDPEHPVIYPIELLGTISSKYPHEDP